MIGRLEVKDLTIRVANASRGAKLGSGIVAGVDFVLEPGDRLGIIGESGSGKSTTALALAGLLGSELAVTGSVTCSGKQVIGAKESDLIPLRGPVVALVFQEPASALDPLMRVGKQLAEPFCRHRGLKGAELSRAVCQAMEEVRLTDIDRIARSFPHQISGGQRQRVAIAMALACKPDILVADEPTTALDVTVQGEILALINALVASRGMTLVFISHDLGVVSQMAEHILVMRRGEVVDRGTFGEILASGQPYTAQLVASAKALENALTRGGLV